LSFYTTAAPLLRFPFAFVFRIVMDAIQPATVSLRTSSAETPVPPAEADLRPTNSSPKRKAEEEPYNGGPQKAPSDIEDSEKSGDGPPFTQPDPPAKPPIKKNLPGYSEKYSDAQLIVLKEISYLKGEDRIEVLTQKAMKGLAHVSDIMAVLESEIKHQSAKPTWHYSAILLILQAEKALGDAASLTFEMKDE
jgi:hypothetical protein